MNLLDSIDSPEDLKKLNRKELKQLCSEIREKIIECCALNPGHIGASLGTVELSVAIHYVYDTPSDKLVWDVGHQAYAHKIITGRRDQFILNRKYKGLSGYPKRSESEYDAFGTGHSSTSISAALGMAIAAEMQHKKEKVIAVIGDGAMTGGLAFEGLNHAGSQKTDLLVILNDNKMSIDKNTGALNNYLIKISTSNFYNKVKNKAWDILGQGKVRKAIQKFMFSTKMAFLKSGSLFESLGFRYFGSIDGNDIDQLITTLTNLKEIKGPKLLHIITKKGKGYKPAEENQITWHAPGVFDKETGKRIITHNGDRSPYQDVFGETLLELAKMNDKIVGITPAMATGCSMNIIMNEMPGRAFDVGIAEQHAVTFSAGLAAEGLLPYCNIYSSFMQRAYDSVIHDVALQNLKVVFCLDRAGIVGEDGATHHGAFDLSYLRPIPNLTVTAPMNEIELRNILYSASLPDYGITTIRYPRGLGEGLQWHIPFEKIPLGKARLLTEGEGIAILSIGTIGNRVARAIEAIRNQRERSGSSFVSPIHYDMRFLKPLDIEALEKVSQNCHTIITIEDGSVIGGLFSAVSEHIALQGLNIRVEALGIPDRFIDQGSIEELLHECGYSETDIQRELERYF